MGSRANYVIVDEAGWRLYYTHWGAAGLDLDLAPGPEHALRALGAAERRDRWLQHPDIEGGALVDTVRRQLIFFGADAGLYLLPQRRAYFALLAGTWPGWTVRWAYDGEQEFLAHLGLDPSVVPVRAPDEEDFVDFVGWKEAGPDELADGGWDLITARRPDGRITGGSTVLAPFNHPAWAGEQLLGWLPDPGSAPVVRAGHPPRRGLHLDLPQRRLGWWDPVPDSVLLRVVHDLWPGWTVEFWEDRYETQLELCGPGVLAPAVDLAQGFTDLEIRLRERPRPLEYARKFLDRMRSLDPSTEAGPYLMTHTQVDPDRAAERRVADGLAAARRRLE